MTSEQEMMSKFAYCNDEYTHYYCGGRYYSHYEGYGDIENRLYDADDTWEIENNWARDMGIEIECYED